MRVVIQRVSRANVKIDGETVGEIGEGLCVLVGVAPDDDEGDAAWLVEKIVNLRIFSDDEGKMNRSLLDIGGSLLAVSQFTLYGDCRKGRRPSFIGAASPERGNELYETFAAGVRNMGITVATGVFGADMKVELVNDGPVTIVIDTADIGGSVKG